MIRNEVIWITGASSGIGKALALTLAKSGNKVIASGRNSQRLEQLQREHPNIQTLAFDVTDKERLSEVGDALRAMAPSLDRVILNAGDCEYFEVSQPDWQSIERMMQVNLVGVVNSISLCLPLLKQAKSPHLIAVGSQAILAPFPRAEGYGASKAALSYLVRSLRIDLHQYGIDVTEVLPGFVDTPLTARNDFPMPFLLSAQQAATQIVSRVSKRPLRVILPRRLQLMLIVANVFPRFWLWLNTRSKKPRCSVEQSKRSKHA